MVVMLYLVAKSGRTVLPLLMAVAMALPMGPVACYGSCGTSQGCATGNQQGASEASCCQKADSCCGCCQHKKDGPNCCAMKKVGESAVAERHVKPQADGAQCVCACRTPEPMDRPVNNQTKQTSDGISAVVAWVAADLKQPDSQRIEIAWSPGALAPAVPHRILHCSWLN